MRVSDWLFDAKSSSN